MSRLSRIVLAAAVAVGCVAASATASAHWHGSVGVWIGPGPYWYGAPYYYPPPYYAYPPAYAPAYPPAVVVDPEYSQPSVHVPPQQSFWYFCPQSNGYYPYVPECPSGWQQVTPHAPPGPTAAPAPGPAPR